MREIKFRAWDKEFKQFSDMALNYKITDINFYADYEWMQYTGLKDKNGKEIYEGDILEFSGNVVALGIVKYNENFATFQACNGNSGWLFGNESGTNIEILGNIYENPELVKN